MGWSYTSNGGIVFDLDDPRFTTPMSVISGLASGYCERRAAVDDTYAAASWTTDAVKKNTVSRLAANIAINHNIGTVSAYGAGSETFQAPQSWTVGQQTKTYMDYFDNDLASLANSYVTSGGVAYNGFDGLAVAASARADSDATVSHYDGYTVGTTATSGGVGGVAGTSEYTGTFLPTFAAGWAVERRDMLEELRYVHDVGSVTSGEWSGKTPTLRPTAEKIVDTEDNNFTRFAEKDMHIVFWSRYTGSYSELYLYAWGQANVTVYTRDESPGNGSSLYASPLQYNRYIDGDDTDNNRFAWKSVGGTPTIVYTYHTSRFVCGDEVTARTGTAGNYSYVSCGIIATTADTKISYTDDATGTVHGYFTRNESMDTQTGFCWTSGNVSVWTQYGPCYSDPGDSVYADPLFDTSIGDISDIVYDYLNVADDAGSVSYSYTAENTAETTVVTITVADVVYTRNSSADTPGQYAWTSTGGTVYTYTALPRIGYTTVGGDTITHVNVTTDDIQTAITLACDNNHASPVQNALVTYGSRLQIPPTGIVSCAIWNLYDWGLQTSGFDTMTWLTTADTQAETRTVQIVGGTGRTTMNSCGDGTIYYDSVNCPTYNITRCDQRNDTDWKRYNVEVGMSYSITGAFVREIDMMGDMIQNKTLTVSVFLGMPRLDHADIFLYSYIHSRSLFLSAAKTYTTTEISNMNNAGGTLIIQSGGTATVANCQVDRVIIEPHGSLVLNGDNAIASAVCALTKVENGAVVSGVVVDPYKTAANNGADKISSYFLDFDLIYSGVDSNTIITGNTTYAGTDRPDKTNVIVTNGATCIFNHFNAYNYGVRINSGCTCSAIGQDTDANHTALQRFIVLPGGKMVISGAVSFSTARSYVHSGAVCSMSGNDVTNKCGMLNLEVHSGGSVIFNDYAWFGGYTGGTYDVHETHIDDGAFFQLKNGNTVAKTPQAIFNWKATFESPARVMLCRFNNNSLKSTPTTGTGVNLHYGWNVIQVTVPTGQNSVKIAQTTAQTMTVDPIKEPLYKGVLNDEFYSDDGPATYMEVGFSVCAYKVDGLTISDKYPQFVYRKFGDDHK